MKNFTKTLLVSATMLVFLVSAVNAATVTYSLKKHIDKGTITATATVSSAVEIPGKLPNILKRAYCTYTYYWDAALTQPVQDTDALQGTVYVDYVFDPPFTISTSSNKVYYFLTTYSTSQGKEWLRNRTTETDVPIGTYYSSGGTPPASSEIRDGQYDYALYGDAYNLRIQNRYTKHYLIPYPSGQTIKHQTAVYQDWNLYTNTTISQGHETCTIGAPAVRGSNKNYSDIWCIQQDWSGASYIARYNSSIGNYTQSAIAWWFDLSMEVANSMYQYRVYMEYDNMTLRTATPLAYWGNGKYPATDFMNSTYSSYRIKGYIYTYYKDEAMTQEYAEGEQIPETKKGITVVYVKESVNPEYFEPYVTDHWITLALSYGVTNLANEFGYAADGVTPAVRVLEYTALTTNEENTKYALTFTETNSIVAHKPYLFKADEVLEGKYLQLAKDLSFYNKTEATLDGYVDGKKVTWKDNAHNSPDVTMIGTSYDKELTVFSEHPNLLYFYFGYDKRYDSASSDYVGEEAAAGKEPYNFYRVTQKPVTMKKNRCYFMIEGAPAGAKFMLMDNFGEEISGVEGFEVERTVPTGRIYNLNGQQVGNDLEALPRGVYIVNGKKVMK